MATATARVTGTAAWEPAGDAITLRVVDAGICLVDHGDGHRGDDDLTLDSLPAAIREAILSVKKYPGAEGEYNFDANGDGLHGYNIVKNENGTIVFDKHIEAAF